MTGDGYYCTVQSVADRLKNIVINNDVDNTITSGVWAYNAYPDAVLKLSQVAQYILEVEARVTDKIALKYKTPIDDSTRAWLRVGEIVRGFVIGQCYPILKMSGRSMEGPDEQKNVMSAYGVAKARLDALMNDDEPFSDATRTVAITDSVSSSETGDGQTTFEKFDPRVTPPRW
jgi:hypothetical protein